MTSLGEQWPIYDIYFSGIQGFAGTDSGTFYYSADDGNNWQIITTTVGSRLYSILNIGDSNYVGTEGYYIHTTQKEQLTAWTPLTNGPKDINVLKHSEGSLWIGTYRQGIWKLALYESRFSNQSEGLSGRALEVWDIVFSQIDVIFLATSNGVYKGDGISSWYPVGLQGETVLSLEVIEENLYAGTKGKGIFQMSLSNTAQWTQQNLGDVDDKPISSYSVRALIYDPVFCKGLFAATDQGVWLRN